MTVVDMMPNDTTLIYQTKFYDFAVIIGENKDSNVWRAKTLQASYITFHNAFRYTNDTGELYHIP